MKHDVVAESSTCLTGRIRMGMNSIDLLKPGKSEARASSGIVRLPKILMLRLFTTKLHRRPRMRTPAGSVGTCGVSPRRLDEGHPRRDGPVLSW